jgi:undecaprenyl-diphosphatase
MMSLWHIIILSIIQGFAELLPVSSSAHVVVAEKLLGINPSAPESTFLLVMLHTGTMFAVILYFWKQWRRAFFSSAESFKHSAFLLILATGFTGVIGEALILFIEKVVLRGTPKAEVEQLFSHLEWIAPALAVAGILIFAAGLYERHRASVMTTPAGPVMDAKQASIIGAVQGLCLPFRGLSRSGATISAGMFVGAARVLAEEFSFALAVMLTPVADGRELLRLMKAHEFSGSASVASAMMPILLGTFCAFLAGLAALEWLSRWLEHGRWYWFGIYCLLAAAGVGFMYHLGY